MINEFYKYAGIRILKFFLFNPNTEIHIKGLARRLKISPATAKLFCEVFTKKGFLNEVKKGNLKIYSLNNESVYVREMKKLFLLLGLKEKGIEKIAKKCVSLAIYGSCASGIFNEKSDLDILIIGKKEDVDMNQALKIEKALGRQLQLTIIPYFDWEKMKKNKKPFVQEVLANHLLIKGAEL